MKKEYTSPIIEVVLFKEEDIITTSCIIGGNQPGDKKIGWGDF